MTHGKMFDVAKIMKSMVKHVMITNVDSEAECGQLNLADVTLGQGVDKNPEINV